MKFAEVAVGSAGGHRHTFTYSIPPSLLLEPGCAVSVPFGPRTVRGIVTALSDITKVAETRDIIGLVSPLPLVTPERISLASWIAGYYMAPVFSALTLMLPPGFESARQVQPKYRKSIALNFEAEQLPDVL